MEDKNSILSSILHGKIKCLIICLTLSLSGSRKFEKIASGYPMNRPTTVPSRPSLFLWHRLFLNIPYSLEEVQLPYIHSPWTRARGGSVLAIVDSLRHITKEKLRNAKPKKAKSNGIFSGSSVAVITFCSCS